MLPASTGESRVPVIDQLVQADEDEAIGVGKRVGTRWPR
jgi:hypothetical protein